MLSKSHNSSLLSYYAAAERPAKLRDDYMGRFGTVSARLRAWGASWTALKARFTCHVPASRGRLDKICEFSKLSLCKIIQKPNRKSVLRLVHNTRKQNKTPCHLGTLKIKLTFRDTCEIIWRDSTVTKITIPLWSSMFQNHAYYIYLPLDYYGLKPVLSYVPSTVQDAADYNVCDNTDIFDEWHESPIPIGSFKENIECSVTDVGHGNVKSFVKTPKIKTFTVSFDDLYEYDDDGNLVAKNQTEFLERMEKEQTLSRIVSETEFYTISSFQLMKMKAFSWQEAESKCKKMGFHLLNIHSISDVKHLLKHLFKYLYEIRIPMYTFYIGIHRKVSFAHTPKKFKASFVLMFPVFCRNRPRESHPSFWPISAELTMLPIFSSNAHSSSKKVTLGMAQSDWSLVQGSNTQHTELT